MGNGESSTTYAASSPPPKPSPAYPTNIYEMVIKTSKELEGFLVSEFGATGKGLHEKISSVQTQLTPQLVKRMRYLATIRNKVVHGETADIPDRSGFIRAYESSKSELRTIINARRLRQEEEEAQQQQRHRYEVRTVTVRYGGPLTQRQQRPNNTDCSIL
jgi:hypothetical protein